MALIQSTMLPLGTKIPDFRLPDAMSGEMISPKTFVHKKALLVMFICVHCPYVKHIRPELARLAKDYKNKDVGIVAVSANDAQNYPEDAPENLKKMGEELKFSFPYCYDESQETAQAFRAACTPDFFIFDQNRRLIYRGQLDDSRPGNEKPLTGADLRQALHAVLFDQRVNPHQKPSIGCSIKWKQGVHV